MTKDAQKVIPKYTALKTIPVQPSFSNFKWIKNNNSRL